MKNNTVHQLHPQYRPDIDGLRAIAVLSVVGFHAFPSKIPGGFIGVDIFFVISGFLISTIIFSNLERDNFSIVDFYSRRVRRIFPALIAVMLASLVFGWYVLVAGEYEQLGKHITGGAAFVSNFILYSESGYFDNAAYTKPLLHLWSLAIEEQFYIFWPLLLAFVWKRKWSFLRITAAIAAISFAANLYLVIRDPIAGFYWPVSRFWELMIGGVLAYTVIHRPRLIEYQKDIQSTIGFILVLAGLLLINKGKSFPGVWALLPTVGAFLLISAGPDALVNRRLLSNRLLVGVGLISYPLYLWHWPLLSYGYIIGTGVSPQRALLLIALSIALAYVTYEFLERPVRIRGQGKLKTALILLSVMAFILVLALLVIFRVIMPRSDVPGAIISAGSDWGYRKGFKLQNNDAPAGVYYLSAKSKSTTLFFGDSHMMQYGPRVVKAINDNMERSNNALFVAVAGCPPIPNVFTDAPEYNCDITRNYVSDIINREEIDTVVIAGCWNCYFTGARISRFESRGYKYYSYENGKKYYFSSGVGLDMALNSLEEFIKSMPREKKRVVLILDNPYSKDFEPASFFRGSRLSGYYLNKSGGSRYVIDDEQKRLRERLIQLAIRQSIKYIDPSSMFCSDDVCAVSTIDGRPIYNDTDHIRSLYVRDNAEFIDSLLNIIKR